MLKLSFLEKKKAIKNSLNYTAKYPDVNALTDDVKEKIANVINTNIAEQGCIKTGDCSTENIDVYKSDVDDDGIDEDTRRKRAVSTVSFTLQLSCDLSSTNG